MLGSALLYFGVTLAGAGVLFMIKPVKRLRVPTRGRAFRLFASGVVLVVVAVFLPVFESRVARAETRLDLVMPAWQFREFHTIRIAAPPSKVYDAIKKVRADEISLFRALTWIRRGGQQGPPNILNAGGSEPILDVATKTGFVWLADDAPRELVLGTVVVAPPGARGTLTPQVFQKELPPGFALATINFLVTADGPDRSILTTETRVFANSPSARRRFAGYWRIIYPGSAIIRRMWLKAVERRATAAVVAAGL